MDDADWCCQLVEKLVSFQKRGYLCDLDLVAIDGTLFPAHSCVIAAASKLLATAIETSESPRTVVQTTVCSDTLPGVIQSIYTGKIKAESDKLLMVHNALSELGVHDEQPSPVPPSGLTSSGEEGVNHFDDEVFSNDGREKDDSASSGTEEPLEECEASVLSTENCIVKDEYVSAPPTQHSQGRVGTARHRNKPWQCKLCGKTFRQKHRLLRHRSSHGDVDGEEGGKEEDGQNHGYACEECYKQFLSKSGLWRHKQIVHEGAQPLTCPLCNSLTKSRNSLVAHLRYIHKMAYTAQDEQLVEISAKVFHCQVCSKAFQRKSHFTRHLLVHSEDRPHSCVVCGKTFKEKTVLEEHTKYVHQGWKRSKPTCTLSQYCCSQCGKGFKHKGTLVTHERKHTGERPYPCRFCEKAFVSSSTRSKHELIHQGRRDFQCATCGKDFGSSGILSNHMRTHSDARPHRCDMCGKCFKFRSHRDRHAKNIHGKH